MSRQRGNEVVRLPLILVFMLLSAASFVSAGEPPDTPFIRIAAEMHSSKIQYASADRDGRLLATASYDKTLKLWDAASGRLLRTLRPPIGRGMEGAFNAVALSPDGTTVAAGGFTGSSWGGSSCVYLFDTAHGEMTGRIPGFKYQIHRLAYSPDGRRLAVTVAGNGLHVLDPSGSRVLFSDAGFKGNLFAMDFAADGTLYVASDRGEIRAYSPAGNVLFRQQSEHQRIFTLAVSPDGASLALGYEWESRREVDILSAVDGSWQMSPNGLKGALQSVAWSHDGSCLLAAGGKSDDSGHKLLFRWSRSSRSIDETIVLPTKYGVRRLVALKNGMTIFVAPYSGFGAVSGGEGSPVAAASRRGGGRKMVRERTQTVDGVLYYHRVAVPDFQKNHDCFKISPDASAVLFSYERYGQGKAVFDLKSRMLKTADVVSDAGFLAPRLTGNGIDVQGWDSAVPKPPKLNRKELKQFGFGGWEVGSCLAVRPDEKGFVLGTSHYLRHYDRRGGLLWKLRTAERAWDVNISADSRTVVASFDDGTIRWFSMEDGRERCALYLHPDRKRWVLWLPDGYFDHGPDSERLVGFVVNRRADQSAEAIDMGRMYDLFYRPDIVEKAVGGQDISAHLQRLKGLAAPPRHQEREHTAAAVREEASAVPLPRKPVREQVVENAPVGETGTDESAVPAGAEGASREPATGRSQLPVESEAPSAPPVAALPPPAEEPAALRQQVALDLLVNRETLPPVVRFVTRSGAATSPEAGIVAELCDAGGGIGDVTVYLNGMPVSFENSRGLAAVPRESPHCLTFRRTVTLKPERNTIAIMAFNRSNTIESRRESIELTLPVTAEERPRLHLLTVAVNNYRDGDLRLRYPLDDAEALIAAVAAQAKGVFSEVVVHRLHDGEVVRQKLEERFAEIGRNTRREDVFLLFLAGHGVTEEQGGMYYFLPVDFRYTGPEAIARQGVSMNDFKRWLSGIQALKSLILLDTCSSGAFTEAIASRGVSEKTAIAKLARSVGRATIAASSKNQVALEGYEGHGVFSYTVLEGIRGKAASPEGLITINRLATFVEETLPGITYRKWGYEQIPQKTLTGTDFPIGIR